MYFIVTKKNGETGFKALTPGELRDLAVSEAKMVVHIDDFYAADEACVIIQGEIVVPEIRVYVRAERGEAVVVL